MASLGLLLLLLPFLLCVAVLCLLIQGRPVLFRQQRPGKDGDIFTLWKFRSMRTSGASDTARITAWGRILRRLGLDELPELWNILKGDMSFVGPRPLLPEYLPRYSPEQARRHEVRPGLTGWAQVHGRNAVDWNRKFELDVWYVDHASPALDAKILLMTLSHLVSRSGGDQIPGEFMG
jgi:lipopolysaccharide/colanic/teichoic acid biosynthesis glycosyltransferase